jgi:hypothetical protein
MREAASFRASILVIAICPLMYLDSKIFHLPVDNLSSERFIQLTG